MKNKRKAILLVGALLCLNLNIFSQNIPLKMNKVSVKKAMTELKEKKWIFICVYSWGCRYEKDC